MKIKNQARLPREATISKSEEQELRREARSGAKHAVQKKGSVSAELSRGLSDLEKFVDTGLFEMQSSIC